MDPVAIQGLMGDMRGAKRIHCIGMCTVRQAAPMANEAMMVILVSYIWRLLERMDRLDQMEGI